ncbi:MAG: hypothetical protein ACK5X3_06275 [Pseudomonadota bacterium]
MFSIPPLSLRAWSALGLVALIAFAGIQTARVDRLKDDLAKAENLAAEALRALAWEKARAETCSAGLARQNAAVEALRAEGAARLAQADKAAADARAVAASARRQADALLGARLEGADVCERAQDVRRRFLEVIP